MDSTKRFQLRRDSELIGAYDTLDGALFAAANAAKDGCGLEGELWDCIRPNHPKCVVAFNSEGIEDALYVATVAHDWQSRAFVLADPWRVPDRYLSRR
jgi:hypothetical protein